MILGAAYMLVLYRRVAFGKVTREDLRGAARPLAAGVRRVRAARARHALDGRLPAILPRRVRGERRRPGAAPRGGAQRRAPGRDCKPPCPGPSRCPRSCSPCAGLVILAVGVIPKRDTFFPASMAVVGALLLTGVLVLGQEEGTAFGGQYVADGFSAFMKLLVAARRRARRCCSRSTGTRSEGLGRFEFSVLVLYATLGGMVMVSANDLMATLSRAGAAVPAALRHRRLPPRRRALGRGGAEVLRARRARLGPAALRRVADLRLRRHHQFRPPRRRADRRASRPRPASWSASSSSSRRSPSRSPPCPSTCGRRTSTRARRRR